MNSILSRYSTTSAGEKTMGTTKFSPAAIMDWSNLTSKYGVRWQDDHAMEHCRLCGEKWSLLRRRHHCRACGQLVCDDCSKTRLKLAGSENLKRACNLCAAARRSSQSGEPPGAEERAREMSVLSQRGREMSVLSVMSQLSPRGGRSDMV